MMFRLPTWISSSSTVRMQPSGISSTISMRFGIASCPASVTARCRSSGIRPGSRHSCRRTFPSTRRTGCPEYRSGQKRLDGRSSYALCNDRNTLLWFANQRAVEYHVTLFRVDHWDQPDFLVLDLDPPRAALFPWWWRLLD
jgi:hypothetical protein